MKLNEIIEKIEKQHYWDARVLHLSCEHFGDEVILVHENNQECYSMYRFLGCYKSDILHIEDYPKKIPYRDFTIPQIPFFMQDVDVKIENELYVFKINAYPLYIEIKCKDIEVKKIVKEECGFISKSI